MARCNLFSGAAPDPAVCPGDAGSGCGAFELTGLGWALILLPFVAFLIGIGVGALRRKKENVDAIADLVS